MDHIEFKGIPVNGSKESFLENLKIKGFEFVEDDDDTITLTGKFANMDCSLIVLLSPISKIIYKVVLYGPEATEWYELKSQYESLKNTYKAKYGKPEHDLEGFTDPYYEGDGNEILAARSEHVIFSAYWHTPSGVISVRICRIPSLQMVYEDAVNADIAAQEREQIALNDI